MTALSEQMKDKICVYCGNNHGGCAADVPYYCVTIWCKFFIEKGAEPIPTKKKRDYSRRKIMRSLVETF